MSFAEFKNLLDNGIGGENEATIESAALQALDGLTDEQLEARQCAQIFLKYASSDRQLSF